MSIRTAVGQILAMVVATAALAQGSDPLHSPECDAARIVLEHAQADASQKLSGSTAKLSTARKQAIEACLGRDTGERMRSGAPDPPIAVAPPAMQLPRSPATPAVVAPPPAAVVIQRPAVITTCDPGGCWDSNGGRLNSVGPMLVGPRGPCVVQGGLAHCP
jgi:hypothetical protein